MADRAAHGHGGHGAADRQPAPTSKRAEVMLVSVSPYAFSSLAHGAARSAARQSAGSASSPPVIISRTSAAARRPARRARASRCQNGARSRTVIRCARCSAAAPRAPWCRWRQRERGAAGQRGEHLLERRVEGDGGELPDAVGRGDLVLARQRADHAGQAAEADGDRLGVAGGPRGVDDVAHCPGAAAPGPCPARGSFAPSSPNWTRRAPVAVPERPAAAVITTAGATWVHIRVRRSAGRAGSSGR